MKTTELLTWLEEQARIAPTYSERVAYNNVIKHIKENNV